MIEGPELGRGNRVVGTALDRQHALRWSGHQHRRLQRRGGFVEQSEPEQARRRQNESVDLAVGELAQAGADVTADRHDLQAAAGGAEQGAPPG